MQRIPAELQIADALETALTAHNKRLSRTGWSERPHRHHTVLKMRTLRQSLRVSTSHKAPPGYKEFSGGGVR